MASQPDGWVAALLLVVADGHRVPRGRRPRLRAAVRGPDVRAARRPPLQDLRRRLQTLCRRTPVVEEL